MTTSRYLGKPCVCDAKLEICDQRCVADMLDTTFYIACLKLTGRKAVVIGGGAIGFEKVEGLLACGAQVMVVAPRAHAGIQQLAEEGSIVWYQRPYEPSDLDGQLIVIASTDDTDTNIEIFAHAEERAMLANIVDVPPLCNFILPAIVRQGPLAIAISTAGASPALAKRMKREISEAFGKPYADLAEILNSHRRWAKDHLPTYHDRKDFFEGIVNGSPDPVELLRNDKRDELETLISERKQAVLVSA